jgi:hypothetical protein
MTHLRLSRAEMIKLVDRIRSGEHHQTVDADVALFVANCLNPKRTDLIFWPHGYPHDASKPEPTSAEIVDQALTPGPVIRL